MQKYIAGLVGSLLLGPAYVMSAETAGVEAPQTLSTEGPIAFELLYRADVISNVAGGLKRGTTALGQIDVKFDFDLDKLVGWVGEATYRAALTPWLSIQPNFQYMINPGADAQIKNATVLGVRFELTMGQ